MKKIFIPLITVIITACGTPDKKTELEKLKKQELELKEQIMALEAELNASGIPSNEIKGIFVSVVKATPQIFKNYIDVLGKVDTEDNITLSSEIPGTITKINVKVGDNVKAGQVLAETDDRAIQQQMLDLQANIDLVNQVYERQKSLWDLKIGTEMQYLKAKTDKESMSKKMAALNEQLRMTKIITPISGVVDAIDVKIGQMSSPGMPSIRVINYSNLKVKAEVAEKYASKIKKGAEVIVRLTDANDSLETKVGFVSRSINPVTRTFNVEVALGNDKEYHPNMVAGLSISDYKSEKPVIVIPVKAIQKDENNAAFVYVADGKKAKKQMVVVGEQYKGKAEIKEGLKDGDLVLDSGYDMVNEGDVISY
jgi:membrane fusion protein, multidrug efflux system